MKIRFLIFTSVLFILFFSGAGIASTKLNVTASLFTLAHFAEQVGGKYADVIAVMPAGVDPHSYEPTARNMVLTYNSRIFIYNGSGIDSWAKKIQSDLEKNGIFVLEIAKHLSALIDDKAKFDPHFWLDPLISKREVEIIRDTFIKIDPLHQNTYRKNSEVYITKLIELDRKFDDGLRSCKTRDIIVTHDAYNYLARRYNINVHPISGLSPEEEPSPRKMGDLSKLATKKNIKYIFFEELVSSRVAETLGSEAGAEILILSPLGQITRKQAIEKKTYISIMEENLSNLRTAMECD